MEKQTRRSHGKKALMLLMTMTLATTCVVGSTYAKYATHDGGGAEARIAKFGVKIMTNGQVFQNEYADKASVTVHSSDSVIAPGTSGETLTIAITGKPEVSIAVTYTGIFTIANWEVEDAKGQKVFYCPLTITVEGKNKKTELSGLTFKTEKEFVTAVNQEIESYSDEYDVKLFENDSVNEVVRIPSVSWRWDFEIKEDTMKKMIEKGLIDGELDDQKKEEIKNTCNSYDTYLANRACEKPGEINDKVATVGIVVQTVIEQID